MMAVAVVVAVAVVIQSTHDSYSNSWYGAERRQPFYSSCWLSSSRFFAADSTETNSSMQEDSASNWILDVSFLLLVPSLLYRSLVSCTLTFRSAFLLSPRFDNASSKQKMKQEQTIIMCVSFVDVSVPNSFK